MYVGTYLAYYEYKLFWRYFQVQKSIFSTDIKIVRIMRNYLPIFTRVQKQVITTNILHLLLIMSEKKGKRKEYA